jgi:hypothetical protein
MERVAKLEAAVAHIEKDIGDIKADVRDIRSEMRGLRYWIIGTGLALAGLIFATFNYQTSWLVKYIDILMKTAK